jgi:tRNA(Met) cytidine acetyltransferase
MDPGCALLQLAGRLRSRLAETKHRGLLLLEGDAEHCRASAYSLMSLADQAQTRWLGQRPGAVRPAPATSLLGGECDLLIIDVHRGFDADALGAAAGTLRGGGLLVLLTPPLNDWPTLTDPEAERIAVYPFGAAEVTGRFIARLARLLAASPTVTCCPPATLDESCFSATASSPKPERGAAPADEQPSSSLSAVPVTADQGRAIDAILGVANGRARRPLVLSSDRGRGKSAALGIAAGRLLAESTKEILVTAPRRAATAAIFEHARAADPGASGRLRFIAPDALLTTGPEADLLLVDEAAGIPAPLLEAMLVRYRRIVFATTIHGYEGTGRGFDLRFRSVLDRLTPGWRALRLLTPIRWAADDPLEQLIDRALLLDAEPAPDAEVAAIMARAGSTPLAFEQLDRDRLAVDETLLRQVFGLLVLAHYQTRPADLRHLLDGPNIAVSVLRAGGTLVATALTAREGRLPHELLAPIFDGRRRPHGHLLPQTLSAHAGLLDAPTLGFTRIVRLAVHPAARLRGIGTQMTQALAERAATDGHDLFGASFGATPGLLRFWRRCGLLPVQLGSHRNAASGVHAAVVLRPLSDAGRGLFDAARERLVQRTSVMLNGPLRLAEPAVIAELLQGAPTGEPPLTDDERRELHAFISASRGFEATLPALHRLTGIALPAALRAGALSPRQAAMLIACILQQRDWNSVVGLIAVSGKPALLRELRTAISCLFLRGSECVFPNASKQSALPRPEI